jgi:hypothetical protein
MLHHRMTSMIRFARKLQQSSYGVVAENRVQKSLAQKLKSIFASFQTNHIFAFAEWLANSVTTAVFVVSGAIIGSESA